MEKVKLSPNVTPSKGSSGLFSGPMGKIGMSSPNTLVSSPIKSPGSHKSLIRYLSMDSTSVHWPRWSSIGKASGQDHARFTIRIEPGILYYSKANTNVTALVAFKEASNHILDMKSQLANDDKSVDTADDELLQQMTMVVFGSNQIERVGCDLDETIKLCRMVICGEGLKDIPPRSAEYQARLEQFISKNSSGQHHIRERREVVNHAMAFVHMVDEIIRDNKAFSEDLIKQTHHILCSDIPITTKDGILTAQGKDYAGKYRRHAVSAGGNNFVVPGRIPGVMARFVSDLNAYLQKAEKEEVIDPFYIAAHACGEFVNIHPFADGNGRICRLILNTILLKYAGIVCPIGEHDTERKDYMDIAVRRGTNEEGNGELAAFTLKKALSTLKRMRRRVMGKDKSKQTS
ncbi:fido domain-containing protein [Elsinoe ampelina]|uniref:Fido domain-containing protein n=1 Tax=Elsinoe ampelina TaxID=302913 RepID=A0A6A6FXJ1_9PEZI|nr:fido domain-containing protein [Elsinoe ampelina]